MKRIVVVSFDYEVDVSKGLRKLIQKHPDAKILIPIEEYGLFAKSALESAMKESEFHLYISETAGSLDRVVNAENITFCSNPIKEVTRQITSEDILAIVWDDGIEVHTVIHSLEDFGLEMWDITDGLGVIEMDYDDEESTEELYSVMVTTLNLFAESLVAYVTSSVLDVLSETIMERIAEEEGNKDISPFDDDL
jgi:hypothetical protein